MTPTETTTILRQFNKWLRGNKDGPQLESRDIRKAIDAAVEMIDRIEVAEKDIALKERVIDALSSELNAVANERDTLRAKVAEMEKQEPVGVLHVGSYYGEELEDWEFEADQCACDKLNEAYVNNPTSLPLYALPGAQPAPSNLAEAIIEDLQAQYDTEGITENDSGDALIRLSDAIAAVEDNFVLAQPAQSEPSDEYVGWYCAHCERGVDASEVTYHEQHQACGRVITDDRPPRHSPSVPDSIIADAARYQFLRNGGAYLEPNEGEIYMATDYGAKYYKDLRDLDMDIDEAIAAAPEAKP